MPNLRIVSDNALERAATLTASSTAGALAAANLVNWKKSSIHRAVATTLAYAATWGAPEPIGCVALPFCNLSPTAQMRVRVSEEGAATNLLRYSEQFDNAAWGAAGGTTGATVVANSAAVLAPNGTQTADRLVEQATNAPHYVAQSASFTAGQAGQKVTFSIFVKAGERTMACIRFDGNSTAAPTVSNAYINLNTGAITGIIAGGWTYSATLHAASGFWRITATGTIAGAGMILPYVLTAVTSGTYSFLGDVTKGLYVWGAQLELSDKASSYYPSGASVGVRPAGYIDGWQSYDYDSGLAPACPWPAAKLRGYTAAQAASAYAYGGGTYARHWLPAEFQARGLKVDIDDPDNLQGYVEVACMVAGPTWSPKYNASAISVTPMDSSESAMTGGGDTCGEAGFISDEISIDLTYMDEADRATVMAMARNSSVYPLLISGFPNDPAPARERDHMIYATRSKSSAIALKYAAAYTTSITFKEV